MRDHADNVVIVCSIENIDPMGVHTGDSRHRRAAADADRPHVPEAARPGDRRDPRGRRRDRRLQRPVRGQPGDRRDRRDRDEPARVALVARSRRRRPASRSRRSPRGSRSATRSTRSRTTSRARTPASFEPTIDYVVVKWPRFAFEKFPGVDARLSTHMKSVGEVMAIGRTFKQAFAKAMRSRELDASLRSSGSDEDLLTRLETPGADRYDVAARGFQQRGVERRRDPRAHRRSTRGSCASCASWRSTRAPFERRAHLQGRRHLRGRVRGRDAVLLLGLGAAPADATRSARGDRPSVMILGSGPNRIGQGIEFDYCCVHAAMTVRESGRDAVMVNCNPETVSTDYDTSDRLYFEPLTLEDVLGDRRGRAARGRDRPVRRPDAAEARRGAGGGGRAAARHAARGDRPRRGPRPLRRAARAARAARRRRTRPRTRPRRRSPPRPRVGFPLLVRPSYVLGGRAMELVYDEDDARRLPAPDARDGRREIFLDRFLENAIEVDVDAICDGEDVWIGGIMQHVEEAGIHSGDSRLRAAAALARRRDAATRSARRRATLALALGVVGLMNVQYGVLRRRPLRDRGQPARVADRAVRVQGDRAAAGQDRLPRDARRAARRPWTCPTIRAATTSRSRRRCCRSTASPAPTRCSGPRCARPAR